MIRRSANALRLRRIIKNVISRQLFVLRSLKEAGKGSAQLDGG